MADITELIERARDGDRQAADRLFASLYDELKRQARGQLAGQPMAMHATSLVHEAYLKLAPAAVARVNDREHFHAMAARAMRQIIIDRARARDARRRGGDFRIESLDTAALRVLADDGGDDDVLALDAALDRLAAVDGDLARLVELRFYAGLELPEIAALVGRSERSLKRDWRRARAFLYRELAPEGATGAFDDGAGPAAP